jgi:RHS repeat-associated protein
VGTATYTAYGTRTTTGTTSAFGYAGQYTDTESGLQWLRARYYDPTTGQFLTVDPAAAATGTRYAYTGGNPITRADLLGLDWWNPLSWDADSLDNASLILSGAALVLTLTGVGAPVAALLEGAAVAASLTAAYKHGEDGDILAMGTSMLAAVPDLGAIAGDGVRIGARAGARIAGTLERATGGAARTLGDRISLFADALWIPQAAVQVFSTSSTGGSSSTGQYGSSSCYGGAA